MEVSLSSMDQLRFGPVTAKARITRGDSVAQLIAEACGMHAELLIVRLPTADISLVQELEKAGAILTDTLIYYEKKRVEKYEVELPLGFSTCQGTADDADLLERTAGEAFKDYFGHYHADPLLDRRDSDAVYSSWARNSCIGNEIADAVILIKAQEEIAAFATMKRIGESECEGVLFGVSPKYRNNGLHMALMKLVQNWGVENGVESFITSTQINNVPVQKNWCRAGLEPVKSFYTFHLWIKR